MTAGPTTTDHPVPEAHRPRRVSGVELLGPYLDSGVDPPPYLARRPEGQVVQLTHLLHLVAEACDGERDLEQVAAQVTDAFGRTVSAENVATLVAQRLRPLGVIEGPDGSAAPGGGDAGPGALLGLRAKRGFVPASTVQVLGRVFAPLFATPVVVVALLALLAFDVHLVTSNGVAPGLRQALYEPALLLGMFGAIVAATAFHEIGHAAACTRGGAKPGAMGFGIHVVWPAFFCDVTDAYRLDRRGRLRTDLGGVFFNALVALAAGGLFLLTDFQPLVLLVMAMHLIAFQQLLPIARLDGAYIIADLAGVPDVLRRMGPILRSLRPGNEPEPEVAELKPWVRRVVTTYLVLLVPVMLGLLVVLVLSAPRMAATAYDAAGLQLDRLRDGADPLAVAAGGVQLAVLALPMAGLALTSSRLTRAGVRRPAMGVPVLLLVLAAGAWTWWPNGDYEPLRAGERGTVGDLVRGVQDIPSGRPAVSEERAAALREVPTERERRAPKAQAATKERDAPARTTERRRTSTQREARRTTTTAPAPAVERPPVATTRAEEPAPAGTVPAEEPPPPPAPAPAQTAPADPAPAPPPEATTPAEPPAP